LRDLTAKVKLVVKLATLPVLSSQRCKACPWATRPELQLLERFVRSIRSRLGMESFKYLRSAPAMTPGAEKL
jgi:hypothetical protein